ncbi:hypothetical protein B0H67DRAFT_684541 [Lasiosphaeris hirsuta]|uniref:Thioredoxin domain-containing protein n=1 Tax=Lasiosphaeris hirsuta TaxID=260670 RepID=A0AA40A7L1_9PEZI|nr:hypothetical protein B0H67DRAFT_684541 [Lasiosphaeris hirsuta]
MKHLGWTLCLTACLPWQALAWNHVNGTKLQGALDSSGYTLIAFVMPSQDTSKSLEAEWVSMQEREKDDNIVSFDCETHPKMCNDLDVSSFPAIRVYHRDGRMDRYRGERKGREISLFLRRTFRPAVFEADEQMAEQLTLLDDVVIMGHIHPDDWNLYDRFYDFAKKHKDDYSFVVTPPGYGATRSRLTCVNNLDDVKHETYETAAVEALEKFTKLCSELLIPELTRRNRKEYLRTSKNVLNFFATTNAEKEAYREDMRPLAKKHADLVQFAIVDATEYPDMVPATGEAETKIGLALIKSMTGVIVPYQVQDGEKLTAKIVGKFLSDAFGIPGQEKSNDAQVPKRGHEQERTHEEL